MIGKMRLKSEACDTGRCDLYLHFICSIVNALAVLFPIKNCQGIDNHFLHHDLRGLQCASSCVVRQLRSETSITGDSCNNINQWRIRLKHFIHLQHLISDMK